MIVARQSTFDVAKFTVWLEDFCLLISPKIPPPWAAASLAFLTGSGYIFIFSLVVGSIFAQLIESNKEKKIVIYMDIFDIYY